MAIIPFTSQDACPRMKKSARKTPLSSLIVCSPRPVLFAFPHWVAKVHTLVAHNRTVKCVSLIRDGETKRDRQVSARKTLRTGAADQNRTAQTVRERQPQEPGSRQQDRRAPLEMARDGAKLDAAALN